MAIVVLSRYADPVFLYERLAYSLWRNNFSCKWMIRLVTCSEERACYFLGQNNVGQNYSLGKNFVTYEKLFYFRYSPFLYHKNNKKRKKNQTNKKHILYFSKIMLNSISLFSVNGGSLFTFGLIISLYRTVFLEILLV